MNLLYLTLSFLTLTSLDFYLKSNISSIGEGGVNLPFLSLFIGLAILLFLWRLITNQSLVIRRSTFVLLLFLTIFVFKIAIDKQSIEALKTYTLATTGGTILFYVLGTFVAIIVGQHWKNSLAKEKYFTFFTVCVLGYFAVSLQLLISVYFELAPDLRSDLFLMKNLDGAYQRAGNFMVISYLVLLMLYAQFVSMRQDKQAFLVRLASMAIFILFAFYTFVALYVVQMFGSNNATVLIAGLGMLMVSIIILLWSRPVKNYLSRNQLTFSRLVFGNVLPRLVLLNVALLSVTVGFVFFVGSYLGQNLSVTRIGGFGSGELSSVGSRLRMLENFGTHISFAPFFGNMNVDCLTTGCGSYVHSLLVTVLSNTGIFGFLLFTFYLVFAYQERLKPNLTIHNHSLLQSNLVNLHAVLCFSMILLIAVLATHLTWATLWFSLGLFMTGIGFRGANE